MPHATASDNVRVPRARRGELLLRLALAGVPHAHLAGSDEALAHVGALTPQTVLEAQTRDALAADLALGLRGLEGVSDARVVIAPSSGGVYADEPRRDASASVRVTLAAGARLPARTVAGIKAFVAGGVPALDADRVTVLDDRGLALDADGGDDAADVQTALQSALDGAFGAGATIVRVHRERLGERRDVRDVRRAAVDGSIARTTTDEHYASTAKKYSKTSATEDRGSNTREEHRVVAPDATARLTVAVFVDAARGLDLAKIRALASATVGTRADRGDAVSVESVAFGDGAAKAVRVARAPGWLLAFASIVPQAATALALVAAVAFGARPLAAAPCVRWSRRRPGAPRATSPAFRPRACAVRSTANRRTSPPPSSPPCRPRRPPRCWSSIPQKNARRSCAGWRAPTRRCCRRRRSCSVAAEFVALADLLRRRSVGRECVGAASAAVASAAAAANLGSTADSFDDTSSSLNAAAVAERGPWRATSRRRARALRDVRLFGARLADAFDDAASRLLRELACDVLARELRIAP